MRQPPQLWLGMVFRRCPATLAALALLALGSSVPTYGQTPPPPTDQTSQGQQDKPAPPVAAQQPTQTPTKPADATSTSPAASEVVTRDSATSFKVRVNLVLLRVVVRDQNGKVVDNLKKEDFLLLDNRKPQTISTFSLETPLSHAVPIVTVSDHPDSDAVEKNPSAVAALPQ